MTRRPAETCVSTLGHGPPVTATTIQCDIQRNVILGTGQAQATRYGVVWREHATDKGYDGEAMLAIIAQCIDVPPDVATGAQRDVERWSSRQESAAMRPESAAIGSPGPG